MSSLMHPACNAIILVTVTLAAVGCQNPSATLTHAGDDPIPDLATPEFVPIPRDGGPTSLDGTAFVASAPPAPSATTLDRSSWSETTIHQPRGQVEVQPKYYTLFEGFSKDPRATGAYPTIATALSTGGESHTAVQDLAAQPAIGMFWLATTPGQIIFMPPWVTVQREPIDGVEWMPAPAPAPAPATKD
ncbi:MAG: hypothetical protein DWH89_01470 [Planctomycetota bacterium]|nr:MAG: hypothetical protein DWH89_01470 [Planctomycetota bacterium]RLS51144.1 MAG: hypothetical protein DWH92_03990 [Planctomycetota bacterium]